MDPQRNDAQADVSQRFLKGVAISVWQNSSDDGCSNWTRHANSRWPFASIGVSTTQGKYKIGKSCDFWNRYEEDIKLAHDVGSNTFRFSFEWARIEPTRGKIDHGAIKRYHEMLDVMERLGIEPNATLHHFTHPTWFEDLGGFMREENIPIFVEWSKLIFKEFAPRIKLWATFNEPTCYTFLAFIAAMMPPAHMGNLVAAGRTMLNILHAHTATYRALKAMPGGKEAMIGLVHHHITFQSRGTSLLHSVSGWMCKWLTYWWGWDVVDHWMHTGEFIWKLPVVGEWIRHQDPDGKPPCDWWGINYYSRVVLNWRLCSTCMPSEVMTDMYYPIYPEGLYQAIKRSSKYNIPMYITETGIADVTDDRRALMIDSYMNAMMRSMADGYDVRGFYYWTLIDNFEWATGFTMRFGLYRWEADGSVDRVLRAGSKALVEFFKKLPDDLKSVILAAKKQQVLMGPEVLGAEQQLEESDFVLVDKKGRGSSDGGGSKAQRRVAATAAATPDQQQPLLAGAAQ